MSIVLLAFFSVLIFTLVHLFSHRIYRYSEHHKNKIFSLFGGIAIAYVFLDLLPRLEASRVYLETIFGALPQFLENLAIPILALAGFLIYFSLDHLVYLSRHKSIKKGQKDMPASGTFIVYFAITAFFNLLIGFILRFEAQSGILPLIVYTVALSMHFIIMDNSLEDHYKQLYLKYGRYGASVMPLVGWIISLFLPESAAGGYLFLAVLSGILLFTSIRNEIPRGGGRSSWLFIVGAVVYSFLLLLVEWLKMIQV